MKPTNDFRAAVLAMTEAQARQTWVREQAYNRERALPYYERLVDAATGEVVATIEAR